MYLVSAIRSEVTKLRHTLFGTVHAALPPAGALLFILYFFLYRNTDGSRRLKLILELTATVFPLLISVITSLNILQEEKAAHFQTLLAVPNRGRLILAKLSVLYGFGTIALVGLYALFLLGIYIIGQTGVVPLTTLVKAVSGMALGSLFLYSFHLFLSLKFGLGISLFCGVFESLQCILYSNIELSGIWRFIPFAWSVEWIHDVQNGRLAAHSTEWISIIALTVCFLTAVIRWFSHWEGRKNYE